MGLGQRSVADYKLVLCGEESDDALLSRDQAVLISRCTTAWSIEIENYEMLSLLQLPLIEVGNAMRAYCYSTASYP